MGWKGVGFIKENRRFYPQREIGAQFPPDPLPGTVSGVSHSSTIGELRGVDIGRTRRHGKACSIRSRPGRVPGIGSTL